MINLSTAIAELDGFDPSLRRVLDRYGVDIHDVSRSLQAVLADHSKDAGFVIELLNLYADPRTFRVANFSQHSLSGILEYLQLTHRFYEQRWLPRLEMCTMGIKQNFPQHPIASVLDPFFRNYRNELLEHIELEENKLFPYAQSLYDGKCMVNYSVKEFRIQHDHHVDDHLGEMLNIIERDYPEITTSMPYRSFRALLQQLEQDLFVHHLIEERVFLVRVHELELEASGHLYQ